MKAVPEPLCGSVLTDNIYLAPTPAFIILVMHNRSHTAYEGFTENDPVMERFWTVGQYMHHW